MRRAILGASACLALLTGSAQAKGLTQQLADSYGEVRAMKATIEQTTSSVTTGKVVQNLTLEMERPGKVRWSFTDGRLMIMDGQQIWHYTPALKQVIRMPQSNDSQSAMSLLQSLDRVDDLFEVTELVLPEASEERGLSLTPKGSEGALAMRLFVTADQTLRRIEIEDAFGTQTDMRFLSVERLKDIPDDRFSFVPPEGVEVVSGLMGGL